MSIFSIDANTNRESIQLSVTKPFNLLLPINTSLQLVVHKLLAMPLLWHHKLNCPIQRICLGFFLTTNSRVTNSHLLRQPNHQHGSFKYSCSIFLLCNEGKIPCWACLKNGQHLIQKKFMLSPFKNCCCLFSYIPNF